MGEWIEINYVTDTLDYVKYVSPFMGEWIEIAVGKADNNWGGVSPFMGEWIEIIIRQC